MTKSDTQKYRAPALEKGLDIIELLAAAREPMSLNRIKAALGRTASELFRMVQVLEYRGYVEAAESGSGFLLTNRLFALGVMARTQTKDLLDVALPVMRRLAGTVRQSCHLAIASGDEMLVIARVESPDDIGVAVKSGFRRPLVSSTSGRVLYAFQPEEVRAEWKARLHASLDEAGWARLDEYAARDRMLGYEQSESAWIKGVTDLSAPVARLGLVVAALTIPYLEPYGGPSVEEAIEHLTASAREISNDLAGRATPDALPGPAAAAEAAARPSRRRRPAA
jgi:DNA-binding IclR family transcriptional regulator